MARVSPSKAQLQQQYENKLKCIFKECGYINNRMIAKTLQGSIWRSTNQITKKSTVIKVAIKKLHKQSVAVIDGKRYNIQENMSKEKRILKTVSMDENAPKSIIKYYDAFKSNLHYYLVMEDGGQSLFDFVLSA
eukprot:395646_1